MAARQSEEILEEARLAAERERDTARREIEAAKENALSEIRDEVVRLSREIAERVLERQVGDEDHRRIADEVLGTVK